MSSSRSLYLNLHLPIPQTRKLTPFHFQQIEFKKPVFFASWKWNLLSWEEEEREEREELRWLREEQRWVREEQRWVHEESRWNSERELLLKEIANLKMRIQELEQRQNDSIGLLEDDNGSSPLMLLEEKERDEGKEIEVAEKAKFWPYNWRPFRGKYQRDINSVNPGGTPLPSGGSPFPGWSNWMLLTIIPMLLPFFKSKWGPLLLLKQKADTVIQEVEDAAEFVEDVARKIDHIADEVADHLPENSKLRKVICAIDKVAEEVIEVSDLAEEVIDKVQDVEHRMEALVEQKETLIEQKKAIDQEKET